MLDIVQLSIFKLPLQLLGLPAQFPDLPAARLLQRLQLATVELLQNSNAFLEETDFALHVVSFSLVHGTQKVVSRGLTEMIIIPLQLPYLL